MPKLDRSSYEGEREQVYVKHYLLEKYLSSWGYIIGGSEWDSLVFVDGFAGPWGSKHEGFADTSFGIAVRALNEVIDGLFEARHIVVRGYAYLSRLNRIPSLNSISLPRRIQPTTSVPLP